MCRRCLPGRGILDLKLVALLDEVAGDLLSADLAPIERTFDQCVIVESRETDPVRSSRFLKTSMRKRIDGDFLFLDCDTLVRGPIDELFTVKAPFAAALQNNTAPSDRFFPRHVVPLYSELGWSSQKPLYYNSGVMLMRDDPRTT